MVFDEGKTWKAVGNNAKIFNNYLGVMVRDTLQPNIMKYVDQDEHARERVITNMKVNCVPFFQNLLFSMYTNTSLCACVSVHIIRK